MSTPTLWVYHFPNCIITLPNCRRCNFSSPQQNFHHHLLQSPTTISLTNNHFHVRASQTNSTGTPPIRRSRKPKSDAEICTDIRQFLTSVGLPEDHIPSTKDLLQHGRNDLANIVRRRGHKQIRDLLTSSLHADLDSLNTEKILDERLDASTSCEDLLTGQNERVDRLVGDVVMPSTEFLQEESSGGMHITDSTQRFDECTSIPVESFANSSAEDDLEELKDHAEEVESVAEGSFHPTEVSTVEIGCSSSSEGLYPNFNNHSSMPTEISGESSSETMWSGNSECEQDTSVGRIVGDINFPLAVPSVENHSDTSFNDSDLHTGDKESSHLEPSIDLFLEPKDRGALEGLDDSYNNITEDVPKTTEFSENKIDSIIRCADSSGVSLDTSFKLSLEEKVANFIQNGDLDPVEGAHQPKDNNVKTLNGNLLSSNQVAPFGKSDQHLWEDHDHMPHEDLITHFENDVDAEAPKVQHQSEINHLKFMLYQKELELSQLKEQIEKEKHALSVLQTKAEEEILKARKLISEKDVELHVAEESLSELKEVKIDFNSDGDVVEVAGSFNGWHHRIKMDPQPSTSGIDHGESRESKLWSTILWLYPGVYEIKFVVDGHWRTDPQQESVSRGHICNNILRVDR